MENMEQLQNSVVVDGSYPSKNVKLIQEWTPSLTNPNHETTKSIETFDSSKNIVQTFEVPTTDQLRYGGDFELKIGNKIEGFLEHLQMGVVMGDGSKFEKDEICDISNIQELVLEQPEKLKCLHHKYLEAGSDVLQALTFCSFMAGSVDNLKVKKLNNTACEIVCKLAADQNSLVAGSICLNADHIKGKDKTHVQTYVKQEMEVFLNCKVDVILCDIFLVEETEWALEVLKNIGVPIAVTLCVDKLGTISGTSLGDCAIRMAKAGANVVGVCCKFDESPKVVIEYVERMKNALDRVGLQGYIMSCSHANELPDNRNHSNHLNQTFTMKSFEPFEQSVENLNARALYEAGVRFFRAGSGLGTSYIQHLSNELLNERAKMPIDIKSSGNVTMDKYQPNRKGSKQYWRSVISPSCYSTTFNLPESA